MATLKHFARWVHKEKPFVTGYPFQGVRIIEIEEPRWNGLSDKQILRLKSACEHRIATCKQKNQNPLLEVTVFYILLTTGLRESELATLNYGQYHHRGFHEVKRSKSKKISTKVPLPNEARDHLDKYLSTRTELSLESPLLVTKYGNRITRFEIIRICRRISKLANAYLEEEEKFNLTPHMLRHSFLKRIADKYDVHIAQKMSGNVS
ncbi:tyrosine-type recombinase/integrase, partial [Candidatus Jidaibacter acanthamoebae]